MPPKKRKAESTDSSETSSSDVAPKPKRKKVEKAPSKTTTKKKKGDGHKYLTPTLTQIRAKADTKFSFYKAVGAKIPNFNSSRSAILRIQT